MISIAHFPLPTTAAPKRIRDRRLRHLHNRFEHARRQRDAATARMIALLTAAGELGEAARRARLAQSSACSCAGCAPEPPCTICGRPPGAVPLHLASAPGACRRCGQGAAL